MLASDRLLRAHVCIPPRTTTTTTTFLSPPLPLSTDLPLYHHHPSLARALSLPLSLSLPLPCRYFEEDESSEQWTFHFSGRQRFECIKEPSGSAARLVRLAFLGPELDEPLLRGYLEGCLAARADGPSADAEAGADADTDADAGAGASAGPDAKRRRTTEGGAAAAGPTPAADPAGSHKAALALLRGDDRLEVAEGCSGGNLAVFRLTMASLARSPHPPVCVRVRARARVCAWNCVVVYGPRARMPGHWWLHPRNLA